MENSAIPYSLLRFNAASSDCMESRLKIITASTGLRAAFLHFWRYKGKHTDNLGTNVKVNNGIYH